MLNFLFNRFQNVVLNEQNEIRKGPTTFSTQNFNKNGFMNLNFKDMKQRTQKT